MSGPISLHAQNVSIESFDAGGIEGTVLCLLQPVFIDADSHSVLLIASPNANVVVDTGTSHFRWHRVDNYLAGDQPVVIGSAVGPEYAIYLQNAAVLPIPTLIGIDPDPPSGTCYALIAYLDGTTTEIAGTCFGQAFIF